MDREKRAWIVRKAAERSIYSRSEHILRPDVGVDEYVAHVEQQIHAALDNQTVDKDPKFALPKYWLMPVKAELNTYLAKFTIEDQKVSPPHPDTEGELAKLYGGPVPGETADEQMDHVHRNSPSTYGLLFARNSRTGEFMVDRTIGDQSGGLSIKKAVDGDKEEKWLEGYKEALRDMTMDRATKVTLFNELATHVDEEVEKRENKRALTRPQQAPPPPPPPPLPPAPRVETIRDFTYGEDEGYL